MITNKYVKPNKELPIGELIKSDTNPKGFEYDDIVSKVKSILISRHPFWGILITPIQVLFTDDPKIKTACTDGERVIFGIEFTHKLTLRQFTFVLAHEVLHISNLHIPRLQAREPRMWNIATDHFINLTLKEQAEIHPDLFDIPDFKVIFNNPKSGIYMDEEFRDWAAEAIYAELMRRDSNSEGESEDKDAEAGDMDDAMSGDLDYEGYENDPTESQESKAKRLEREMKRRMAQAADAGQKAGNLPGSLARWAKELLTPKVDWQTVLAAYLSMTPSDYEWTSPDRRFTDWDFVVPDMVGEKLKAYGVIDTSGSISEEQITEFISELHHIIRSFHKVEGVLIGHDTDVHDWIEFDDQDPPTGFTGGGGGTNFHPVPAEIKKRGEDPAVLIWFTDLYAEMIDDPGYPVIFVAVDTPLSGPDWATTIHVETR